MTNVIKIANKIIGDGHPCFIIGEIGINHNGSIELAKQLIAEAKECGCDAVKLQKRTVDVVYTKEELERSRPNHFGETNGDLKRGLEFGYEEFKEIVEYCKSLDIIWFASCWDEQSVDFIEQFNPPCYKIASACLADKELLEYTKATGKPILLATGMSTLEEIDAAMKILCDTQVAILQCTSTYPASVDELNLSIIPQFKERYKVPVGYSGHEKGIAPSFMAVGLGACIVERHITIDRTLWGSDQAASLEPEGLRRMVRDIRNLPLMLGNPKKALLETEIPIRNKLRRKSTILC